MKLFKILSLSAMVFLGVSINVASANGCKSAVKTTYEKIQKGDFFGVNEGEKFSASNIKMGAAVRMKVDKTFVIFTYDGAIAGDREAQETGFTIFDKDCNLIEFHSNEFMSDEDLAKFLE